MQINKNLKFIIFCFIVFLSFDSHTDEGFSISAVIETPQVEINGNADDPAIWFNEVDPSLSIVFGTDKYNGVYSYNLSGDVIGFSKSGSMNNIDLRLSITIHIFLQLILQITLLMYGFIKILTYTTNQKRGLLPLIKFLITPVKLTF